MPVAYDPTWESLESHPLPDWYDDAKLGIFIHWGPYAVPGWAPLGSYAEWYPYHMYDADSEHYDYHREHYGEDVSYLDLAERWEAENWDPDRWAELFDDVGARYVVMTAEHHDGFPLWPTHYSKYNAGEMGPERDLVGELCEAVRDRGLRFGGSYHANLNYYQPGFEGQFGHPDFHAETVEDAQPGSEYVDFMNAKHRELIRRYEPDLLWFDVPRAEGDHLGAQELLAEYYETAANDWEKGVVVNDRAASDSWGHYGDFVTPEYDHPDGRLEKKWELCRGIGSSFGFNRNEGPDEHMNGSDLIQLFVDVVSRNGNLLINVGPRADGTIPDLQREPLEALGGWLSDHEEAIYGTRSWEHYEDEEADIDVRYTWRDGTLYAHLMEWPDDVSLGALGSSRGDDVALLSGGERIPVDAERDANALTIDLSGVERPTEYVPVLAVGGVENARESDEE
ncbi:alpha-L-fucosidase [Halosimplex sp. J119]